MALPKIKHPVFEITIPSSKQKAKFRPFLVKEEKVLLLAQESGNNKDMMLGVMQIINNCIVEGDFKVDELPTFDIEYLFLRIRATSVDDISKLKFTDPDTNEETEASVDLKKVEVKFSDDHSTKIELGDGLTLQMKYPTYSSIENLDTENANLKETTEKMINICIDKLYQGDEVFDFKDYSEAEVNEFVDSLTSNNFKDIQNFFDTMPKLEHTVKYKVGNKNKQHTFAGIADFFS